MLKKSQIYLDSAFLFKFKIFNQIKLGGDLNLEGKNYEKALYFYNEANQLAIKQGNQSFIAESIIDLGRYYFKIGKLDKSLIKINHGLGIANAIGDKYLVIYGLENKLNVQKSINDIDSTYNTLLQLNFAKQATAGIETLGEIDFQEQIIRDVNSEIKFNELEYDYIKISNERNVILWVCLLFLALSLVFSILVIISKIKIKELKLLLSAKEEEVEILKKSRPFFQGDKLRFKIRE